MLLISLALYFSHIKVFALPAPSQNTSQNAAQNITTQESATVGWVSTPQVRGTFDLLLSCLTTLALCAWTAYHPNVQCERGFWHQTGHRLLWMGMAIFVPEIVLYCAWQQWWTSRKLRETINNMGYAAFQGKDTPNADFLPKECCPLFRSHDTPDGTTSSASSDYNLSALFQEEEQIPITKEEVLKQNIWTMEQAFFALSGGFAVDSSSFSPHTRLTFTLPGIVFLAKLGLLPDESPETVSDKSKADYVAKVLVCLQAGWFLVQCIARLIKKLPLTLLELHVLAHVLCAFAMYLLWIQKPYDVMSPILCRDERVVDLAALFGLHVEEETAWTTAACAHTSSINPTQVQTAHAKAAHTTKSHYHYGKIMLRYFELDDRLSKARKSRHPPPLTPAPNPLELEHQNRANRALAYLKSRDVHLGYACFHPRPTAESPCPSPSPSPSSSPGSASTPDAPIQAQEEEEEQEDEDEDEDEVSDPNNQTPAYAYPAPHALHLPTPFVVPTRSNLSINGAPSLTLTSAATKADPVYMATALTANADKPAMLAVNALAVLSPLYGGLHLLAWNAMFPTEGERWAWRAAGIVMVAAPVGSAAWIGGLKGGGWADRRRKGVMKNYGVGNGNGNGDAKNDVEPDGENEDEEEAEQQAGNRNSAPIPVTDASKPTGGAKLKRQLKRSMLLLYFRFISLLGAIAFWSMMWVAVIGWAAYPFARLYVLGEAFAGLRAVERDVYKTVEWSEFVPHVG